MSNALRYEAWDSCEAWLRGALALPEDAWEYLSLTDRTVREAELALGRRNRQEGPDPFLNTADDVVQWLRETASGNACGAERTVFRVRTWTARGGNSSAGSRQFVVYDENAPRADEGRTLSPGEAEGHATVAGIRNLGDHYNAFARILIEAFQGLSAIYTNTAQGLHTENQATRSQAIALFRAQLEDRRETDENEALVKVHEADSRIKGEAINKGMALLEKLGLAFSAELKTARTQPGAADKAPSNGSNGMTGIPPELLQIGAILQSSPELSSALTDPAVQQILRDPMAQQGLAEILHDLATVVTEGAVSAAASEHAEPPEAPQES